MNERQTGEGRQDQWTSQGERERNPGAGRSMTRAPQGGGGMQQEGRSSGDWTGYVVPYRYYGPGYRGVGYYSVFYQGSGDEQGGDADWDDRSHDRTQPHGTGIGRADASRRGGSRETEFGGSGYGGASGYGSSGGGRGYSGRGPRGYQRSDERIRDDVNDRLMADDRIDASDIETQVRDGEVTLTGTVVDRWMKRLAEDVVEQVMGVREVMNQIRVSQGQSNQPEGQWPSGQTKQTVKSGQASQTSRSGQTGQTEQTGQTGQTGQSQTSGDSNGRRQKAGSASR